MRRFFFREEHHAGQPVSGWFYFSKITDMDFDRKNSEMQRHCDLLNVTKVFNGRVQTWPGATKDTSAKVQGEHSLSEGILESLVFSQGQQCTPGLEGLPWILSGPAAQGHRLGLNWAGGYFFFLFGLETLSTHCQRDISIINNTYQSLSFDSWTICFISAQLYFPFHPWIVLKQI